MVTKGLSIVAKKISSIFKSKTSDHALTAKESDSNPFPTISFPASQNYHFSMILLNHSLRPSIIGFKTQSDRKLLQRLLHTCRSLHWYSPGKVNSPLTSRDVRKVHKLQEELSKDVEHHIPHRTLYQEDFMLLIFYLELHFYQ